MSKVYVVDDKDIMRESMVEVLSAAGHETTGFQSAADLLAAFETAPADAVVTDLKMPGLSGIELLEKLAPVAPGVPVILVTAYATVETAVEAMKRGAFDYITKPFKADELEVVIDRALEHRRVTRENEVLRAEVEKDRAAWKFVGASVAVRKLLELVRQIAPTSSTVLIRGESGTGKELVARMIHRQSPRKDKPFLCVNCAALSAGVLESELFGHEKGAFTGAHSDRKGRFELADGGSILLDEISEINLDLQAKLLRVLQEGEFERVGSSRTVKTDVRVVATTNRDLDAEIRNGNFREDLFFRLNVLPIEVPPLRMRRDDIPLLCEYFIGRSASSGSARRRSFTSDALGLLGSYDFPGNVRELENLVQRALVLVRENEISADDIRAWLGTGRAEKPAQPSDVTIAPGVTLDELEKRQILATLKALGGKREATAKALGISVRSLQMKLRAYAQDAG